MNWFKFHGEFAWDHKVQTMTEPMQRRLVMILCLHSTGELSKMTDEELGFALRIKPSELRKTRDLFVRKGFIGETWVPLNWDKRQAPADPGAAERMRRMRERDRERDASALRNVTANGERHVTPELRVDKIRGREEGEGEEIPPSPPSFSLGPEYTKTAEFAAKIGGDPSWEHWVHAQGMCGHSAAAIRQALEECAGSGRLNQAYAAAKLRGWKDEGGPPKRSKSRHPGELDGRTAVQQPDSETRQVLVRPDLPRTPEFEHIHAMWDRVEARQRGEIQ